MYAIQEYKGELKPFLTRVSVSSFALSFECNPVSLAMAKYVLEIIIEKAIRKIQDNEDAIKAARAQTQHLEQKAKKFDRKQKQLVLAQSARL